MLSPLGWSKGHRKLEASRTAHDNSRSLCETQAVELDGRFPLSRFLCNHLSIAAIGRTRFVLSISPLATRAPPASRHMYRPRAENAIRPAMQPRRNEDPELDEEDAAAHQFGTA